MMNFDDWSLLDSVTAIIPLSILGVFIAGIVLITKAFRDKYK